MCIFLKGSRTYWKIGNGIYFTDIRLKLLICQDFILVVITTALWILCVLQMIFKGFYLCPETIYVNYLLWIPTKQLHQSRQFFSEDFISHKLFFENLYPQIPSPGKCFINSVTMPQIIQGQKYVCRASIKRKRLMN